MTSPEIEDRGQLGRGGMNVVRGAYGPQLQRYAALVVLHGVDGSDPAQARERLLAEARVIGQLDPPNVAPIHARVLVRTPADRFSELEVRPARASS